MNKYAQKGALKSCSVALKLPTSPRVQAHHKGHYRDGEIKRECLPERASKGEPDIKERAPYARMQGKCGDLQAR